MPARPPGRECVSADLQAKQEHYRQQPPLAQQALPEAEVLKCRHATFLKSFGWTSFERENVGKEDCRIV